MNDAPLAKDDTGSVLENATLTTTATQGVLNTFTSTTVGSVADTDVDGGTLTVTAIRTGTEAGTGTSGTVGSALGGTYGTLTLNQDGSYSYVADKADSLAAGVTAMDVFTYTISDGKGGTDTAQLTITITGVNDPSAITSVTSVIVSEEGLPGGLKDAYMMPGTMPDATDSTVAVGKITFTDVDNFSASNFTVRLDSTQTLTSGGAPVTWMWNAADKTLYGYTTSMSDPTIKVTLGAVTAVAGGFEATYTATLLKPIDHSTTANTEDVKALALTATVSDGAATTVAGFTVSVEDDMPHLSSTSASLGIKPTTTNITFILDLSGSMSEANSSGQTRLDIAKQALVNLLDAYDKFSDVRINLIGFSTYAGSMDNTWLTVAEVKLLLPALYANADTNYDAALQAAINGYAQTGKFDSPTQNVVYFISDGEPTRGSGDTTTLSGVLRGDGLNITSSADNGIQSQEEALWTQFLTTNKINSYAYAVGPTASTYASYLNPIAYNGITGTNTLATVVSDPNTLDAQLQSTVVPPATQGNLLTGTAGTVGFGADGGWVSIFKIDGYTYTFNNANGTLIVKDTNGVVINPSTPTSPTPYTYDSTAHVATITTATTGKLALDFDTGDYWYTAKPGDYTTYAESIGYTVQDRDGDTATIASTTLNIYRISAMGDYVITNNPSGSITIPSEVLMANDFITSSTNVTGVSNPQGGTFPAGGNPNPAVSITYTFAADQTYKTTAETLANDTIASAVDLTSPTLWGVVPNTAGADATNVPFQWYQSTKFTGTMSSSSDVDMVKVTLTAGQTLIADVDLGYSGTYPVDTYLEILDASGNSIYSINEMDRYTPYDPGSASIYDPMLTFTAPTAGTYYVAVGFANYGYPGYSGSTYQLWLTKETLASHAFDYTISDGVITDTANVDLITVTGNTINGTFASETLVGRDLLADTLNGGAGNDVLYGGSSTAATADTMTGGSGADKFVFIGTSSFATISDFSTAEGDKLAFGGISTMADLGTASWNNTSKLLSFSGGTQLTLTNVSTTNINDWLLNNAIVI